MGIIFGIIASYFVLSFLYTLFNHHKICPKCGDWLHVDIHCHAYPWCTKCGWLGKNLPLIKFSQVNDLEDCFESEDKVNELGDCYEDREDYSSAGGNEEIENYVIDFAGGKSGELDGFENKVEDYGDQSTNEVISELGDEEDDYENEVEDYGDHSDNEFIYELDDEEDDDHEIEDYDINPDDEIVSKQDGIEQDDDGQEDDYESEDEEDEYESEDEEDEYESEDDDD